MKVYIASSWKNQHAVEMLTEKIRALDIHVDSFVEKAVNDEGRGNIKFDFVQWINSEDGLDKFIFDTEAAMDADVVVYIGPAGTDAWAEVGAAFGRGVPVLGLWAKDEPAGLMRRMMIEWFTNYRDLLEIVKQHKEMTEAA